MILANCLKLTKKYITLAELRNSYEEQVAAFEAKSVGLLQGCYNGNYDCALLIIRWKHKLWGNRTALELADTAQLEKFMAHDAVQDLLDKVRDLLNAPDRPSNILTVQMRDPWIKFGLVEVSHVKTVE